MKVSFQLDKRSKQTNKTIIGYASFHPEKPVKFSTKINIPENNWNQSQHDINGTTNELIDAKDQLYKIKRFIDVELPKKYGGYFSREEFKNEISDLINHGNSRRGDEEKNLLYYFGKYREMNPNLEYNTLRMYGTVEDNLRAFMKDNRLSDNVKRLEDKAYSLKFFSEYLQWMFNVKNYLNPSAETDFKKINRILNYFDLDVKCHKSKLFNSFNKKLNYEQTKSVLVTPEEAEAMWKYKARTQNEFEAQMCYLFAYETGLEVSALFGVSEDKIRDINAMGKDGSHIKFQVMDVITKKHRDSNMRTIYLTPRAKEILKQCKGPYSVSDVDQKTKERIDYPNCALPVNFNMLNRNIKKVCRHVALEQRKLAWANGNNDFDPSFEEKITYIKYQAGKKIVVTKPKWEWVTMHTARHSFINNAEDLGLNVTEAGKLAGHASHKTTEKHYQRNNIEVPLLKLHQAKTA